MNYLLNLLILIPFIGMVFTFAVKYPNVRTSRNVRNVRLIVSTTQMLLCLIMLFFNGIVNDAHYSFSKSSSISGIKYELAADGTSLLFMTVAAFFFFFASLIDWNTKLKTPKDYSALFLWLESMLFGLFCAGDIISFAFFFIGTIIPFCLLIRIYNFSDKDRYFYSPLFVLVFGCVGIMLFSLLLLEKYSGSSLFTLLPKCHISEDKLLIIKTSLFVALIGIGYFFPLLSSNKGNYSAPIGVFYASEVIPFFIGMYALIKLFTTLPPTDSGYILILFNTISAAILLYLTLKTIIQKDLRKIITCYSGIYITICFIGILSMSPISKQGAFILTLNYIPIISALIFVTSTIIEKVKIIHIFEISGLCQFMPLFSVLFFITAICAAFFPTTGGFSGFFLILCGIFPFSKTLSIVIILCIMTTAAYIMYGYQNITLGNVPEKIKNIEDISVRNGTLLLLCLGFSFGIGLFTDWFLIIGLQ